MRAPPACPCLPFPAHSAPARPASARPGARPPCPPAPLSPRLPAPPLPRAGLKLQSLLEGPAGEITIKKGANATKPTLLTSSGQSIPVYQYKLKGGDAEVYTIKGVLVPGDAAAAPAPAPAA